MQGRTENNRVVNFSPVGAGLVPAQNVGADLRVCPGEHTGSPLQLIGKFVKIKIQEALPNSLRGILID